jgi:hypothetical protein
MWCSHIARNYIPRPGTFAPITAEAMVFKVRLALWYQDRDNDVEMMRLNEPAETPAEILGHIVPKKVGILDHLSKKSVDQKAPAE